MTRNLKFKERFGKFAGPGDEIETKVGKLTVKARIEYDEDMGPPWKEHDGHGPVSEWTSRSKRPGERVLCEDRGSKRYYDWQAAIQQAKDDGWGFLPHKLEIEKDGDSYPCGGRATAGPFTAYDAEDFNKAIHDVYKQHQATMTAGQYAEKAVERDFQYLQDWCNDKWHWVGVVLAVYKGGIELADHAASLWGIDAGDNEDDYLTDVADELLPEALEAAQRALELVTA